jgi:hypothetical protein
MMIGQARGPRPVMIQKMIPSAVACAGKGGIRDSREGEPFAGGEKNRSGHV